MNRIMGLAGESLIEANWLQPFADSMMSLKSQMLDISRSLEQLQESLNSATPNYLLQSDNILEKWDGVWRFTEK